MEKMPYRCTSCDQRFRRSYKPRLCPWCGKETVSVDRSEGAAADILKEIEDMESQFTR